MDPVVTYYDNISEYRRDVLTSTVRYCTMSLIKKVGTVVSIDTINKIIDISVSDNVPNGIQYNSFEIRALGTTKFNDRFEDINTATFKLFDIKKFIGIDIVRRPDYCTEENEIRRIYYGY